MAIFKTSYPVYIRNSGGTWSFPVYINSKQGGVILPGENNTAPGSYEPAKSCVADFYSYRSNQYKQKNK